MVKPDKYKKTKFSRDKVQASSEEDIIKNNAAFEEQRLKRLQEREKNKKKAETGESSDNESDT
jgi:hypothetical protein